MAAVAVSRSEAVAMQNTESTNQNNGNRNVQRTTRDGST